MNTPEQIVENLKSMPDEKLELIINFMPDLSLVAQLILEERQKRQLDQGATE